MLLLESIILQIKKNRSLAFKNNAPFISCISKINGVLIDNAEDLDIVMPMYNFLEYSKNYSKTSGSLWNYYKDELTDETNDDNNLNKNVINSKSFKYKTGITENTYNVPRRICNAAGQGINNPDYSANRQGTKEVELAVPLKYLSNFWRALDMPLINCEVSLTLTWSENCVIATFDKRTVRDTNNRDNSPTNAAFKITHCKLHVPVVTVSAENDKKLLEQLKTGFKRTITWNKHRSEMSNQTVNNNLKVNPDLKQQINFIGRLEEDATMLLLLRKKKKLLLIFHKIL